MMGKEPAVARDALRRAIRLGRTSIEDAILILYSYQVEGENPGQALPDLESIDPDKLPNRVARENLLFALSASWSWRKKEKSLSYLNQYFAGRNLATAIVASDEWTLDDLSFAAHKQHSSDDLITVIMTSYNSEEFVARAIESVLQQTYQNIELIVVDDKSSDSTPTIVQDIASRDTRVRLRVNDHNVGTYACKNLGLLMANGRYITCHDSDDISHPQKLEKQLGALFKRKDAVASLSRWVRVDSTGEIIPKRWGRVLHDNPSPLLYRREVIDTVGFYDCVRTSADTEFQERLKATFGQRSVVKVPHCLAFGRMRIDSLTGGSEFGFDSYGGSPLRQDYWRQWSRWHRAHRETEGDRLFVHFPPDRMNRPFEAPEEMLVNLDEIQKLYDQMSHLPGQLIHDEDTKQ